MFLFFAYHLCILRARELTRTFHQDVTAWSSSQVVVIQTVDSGEAARCTVLYIIF
jgi:hypothetical protein